MVLRLDQIEKGLVRVVVLGDVRVRDVDLGEDLLVHQFFVGEAAPDVVLQIVQRHVLCLELTIELLLGERRLDLGELGVDLLVGGDEVELGGALLLDVVVDEIAQDLQVSDLGLYRRRLLRAVPEIGAVIALQRGLVNGMTVDGGNHVRLMRTVAARGRHQTEEPQGRPRLSQRWNGEMGRLEQGRTHSTELLALGLLRDAFGAKRISPARGLHGPAHKVIVSPRRVPLAAWASCVRAPLPGMAMGVR